MNCNGNCANCIYKHIEIKINTKPAEEKFIKEEESPEIMETGLMVANQNMPEVFEDAGSYELTKNIFGKPVVKRLKNGIK